MTILFSTISSKTKGLTEWYSAIQRQPESQEQKGSGAPAQCPRRRHRQFLNFSLSTYMIPLYWGLHNLYSLDSSLLPKKTTNHWEQSEVGRNRSPHTISSVRQVTRRHSSCPWSLLEFSTLLRLFFFFFFHCHLKVGIEKPMVRSSLCNTLEPSA